MWRMQTHATERARARPVLWTAAVLLAAVPLTAMLGLTLWRTPFPVSEAVAIFEDIADRSATQFLIPDTSYYRPLYHLSMSAIWHHAASLDLALAWVKALQIAPMLALVLLVILHLRPGTAADAAAAVVATAVLVGSPGFADNMELPLSYTTVGMPLAVAAWMLLTRERRTWHAPALVLLALVAIGFKEQGLVLVPLVIAAWWTRAPGASGTAAAALAAVTAAYVVIRLAWRASWPMFEQAVGLGFGEMEPADAFQRFGAFPYFIYAYSGASTVANVLFAEPTRGTFSIVRAVVRGDPQPWQLVHLVSSVMLTGVIAWWGLRAVRSVRQTGWSPDARLAVALALVLLASGALSFNYSRDRLGGMAVPFYAIAAYHALRAAAARAAAAPRLPYAAASVVLVVIAAGWQLRAVGTLERVRFLSLRNHTEWVVALPERRLEFARRATYLRIMESMVAQGAAPGAPRPTAFPRAFSPWVGPW
jgi:hypothetical protein